MSYFIQETERLLFRKLTEADVSEWRAFFIDNPNLPYIGLDLSKDPDTLAHNWIFKQFERYETQGLGHLAAIEKDSGTFIGLGGIIPRAIEGKDEFEIAYSLLPAYWGKGFGTELACQMRKFGFENNIAKRFISIIHKDNKGSMHVAEKNGMQVLFESIFMDMDVFVYGTPSNLQTERTKLNLLTEADYPAVLALFMEPDMFKYIAPSQNKTKAQHIDFMKLKMQEIHAHKGFYWVVRSLDTNELIGGMNLTPISGTDDVQIGWLIKTKFRGQGYAFESAKAILDFAIEYKRFDPIYAIYESENIASEKIIKKLNFTFLENTIEDEIKLYKYFYKID